MQEASIKSRLFAKQHGFKPLLGLKNEHMDIRGEAINGITIFRYFHELTGNIMILPSRNDKAIAKNISDTGEICIAYRIFKDREEYDLAYQNWSYQGEHRNGSAEITRNALIDCGLYYVDHHDGDEFSLFGEYGE